MKAKAIAKSVLILLVIGTFVSAQQASAESVFTPKGFDLISARAAGQLSPAGASAPIAAPAALGFRSFATDTVETIEIEIEEEKGPGVIKQLAVFAIITAIVGYAVIVLMQTDDEPPEPSKPAGKEIPTFSSAAGVPPAIIR